MKNARTIGVTKALRMLQKQFPFPGAMELGDPFRTIVAVLLSARTRDEQVLKLLPEFFYAFPTPSALAGASEKRIQEKINTIGMFRQKARHLQRLARRLMRVYGGRVPDTMEDLVTLPGVGRKTASVVLVSVFHQSAIAVDTHVQRVTHRLGWVKTTLPKETERALMCLVPKPLWKTVNRVFVKFGRSICIPGRPLCWACPLRDVCAFQKKNLVRPKQAEEILQRGQKREEEIQRLRFTVEI
jgi:endonuclease-3